MKVTVFFPFECDNTQDYGPKVNFKRQRVRPGKFTGLPSYSEFIIKRFNQLLATQQPPGLVFNPVELCNLEYSPDRGAAIVPHLDDSWLWGDRLVTLNLCSRTILTFTLPVKQDSDTEECAKEFARLQHHIPFSESDLEVS